MHYAPSVSSSHYIPMSPSYSTGFTIPQGPRFVEAPSDMVNNAQALMDSYLTTFFHDVSSPSEVGQMIHEEISKKQYSSEHVQILSDKLWQRLYDMESTKVTMRVYLSSSRNEIGDLVRYKERLDKVWRKVQNHIFRVGQEIAQLHPAYVRNTSISMMVKVRFVLGEVCRTNHFFNHLKTLEELLTMQIRVAQECIQDLPAPRESILLASSSRY